MSGSILVSCDRTTGPGQVHGLIEEFKSVEHAKASGWYVPSERITVCPAHTTYLERNRG